MDYCVHVNKPPPVTQSPFAAETEPSDPSARQLEFAPSETGVRYALDLSSAYPDSGAERVVRAYDYRRAGAEIGGGLTVTDTVTDTVTEPATDASTEETLATDVSSDGTTAVAPSTEGCSSVVSVGSLVIPAMVAAFVVRKKNR